VTSSRCNRRFSVGNVPTGVLLRAPEKTSVSVHNHVNAYIRARCNAGPLVSPSKSIADREQLLAGGRLNGFERRGNVGIEPAKRIQMVAAGTEHNLRRVPFIIDGDKTSSLDDHKLNYRYGAGASPLNARNVPDMLCLVHRRSPHSLFASRKFAAVDNALIAIFS